MPQTFHMRLVRRCATGDPGANNADFIFASALRFRAIWKSVINNQKKALPRRILWMQNCERRVPSRPRRTPSISMRFSSAGSTPGWLQERMTCRQSSAEHVGACVHLSAEKVTISGADHFVITASQTLISASAEEMSFEEIKARLLDVR